MLYDMSTAPGFSQRLDDQLMNWGFSPLFRRGLFALHMILRWVTAQRKGLVAA